MPDIKGKVYKFAGCQVRKYEKSDDLLLTAVFCGVADDPENLPRISFGAVLDNVPLPVRVHLDSDRMMQAIVTHDRYVSTTHVSDNNRHVRDVSIDLGPNKLRRVLALCSTVSTKDIPDCESVFIPAARLKL
jgi:hypothetical protein